ncbi:MULTISPECIES: CCRG-2 family RiPP [Prochlorococcus]|uniref:CCRG-2 family RiPP n=1 Tax=Prochlorococcus TaxID=1218 RepID=UPI0007B32FF6|nr:MULTISPECIES: CCRG-2 family RiPP [Prochlorococcus]KZR64645.1 hypothetical protein PMIT1312_01364 [Prochlorococcus marinus str. MIT 1312]KZR79210.1 hypothetical protein PMIT1327_02417 [Prochlorococcus marinus str. MIT 1327]NMO84231.1 CCRG-2 family RiPP [Prochlorococcus sp. P1344]NMP07147.1 CCRG-2 family RiPP [Prochlorococcus sp. P1361]NMP12343.1 CCRG-2 family RiPP [Prochlorococcus sp.P1363]
MTNPKENEEMNEELSADELKSVSGGLRGQGSSGDTVKGGSSEDFLAGHGSGSGMTKADFEKANKTGLAGWDPYN